MSASQRRALHSGESPGIFGWSLADFAYNYRAVDDVRAGYGVIAAFFYFCADSAYAIAGFAELAIRADAFHSDECPSDAHERNAHLA
jgi:hypothetical protein